MSKQGDSPAEGRSETVENPYPMTRSASASKSDGFVLVAPYIVELSDDDIREIEHHALPGFKKLGLNGDEASRHNFDLPTVKNKLERAAHEVHETCGVSMIRGLDPSRLSPEDNLTVFLALSDFVGDVRGVQNRNGDMIMHITDARQWNAPYSLRHGIHTNGHMPFHNDMGADILALQVRQCAKEGGDTYVAWAEKISRELDARRPDIKETLERPDWPVQVFVSPVPLFKRHCHPHSTTRPGRQSTSPNRFVRVPLLQRLCGKTMISLDPGRLGLHPSVAYHFGKDAVPPLTPSQQEALAVVSSIATEYRLRLDTRPGDLVYINNWALLHARSSYEDSEEECGPRRHLLRLWLRNSALGWEIPTGMKIPWEAAFGPDGMGDKTTENGWRKSAYRGSGLFRRNYPVMPAPVYKVPKYTSSTAAFLIEDGQDAEFGD